MHCGFTSCLCAVDPLCLAALLVGFGIGWPKIVFAQSRVKRGKAETKPGKAAREGEEVVAQSWKGSGERREETKMDNSRWSRESEQRWVMQQQVRDRETRDGEILFVSIVKPKLTLPISLPKNRVLCRGWSQFMCRFFPCLYYCGALDCADLSNDNNPTPWAIHYG